MEVDGTAQRLFLKTAFTSLLNVCETNPIPFRAPLGVQQHCSRGKYLLFGNSDTNDFEAGKTNSFQNRLPVIAASQAASCWGGNVSVERVSTGCAHPHSLASSRQRLCVGIGVPDWMSNGCVSNDGWLFASASVGGGCGAAM
jgi:hypothetical protein